MLLLRGELKSGKEGLSLGIRNLAVEGVRSMVYLEVGGHLGVFLSPLSPLSLGWNAMLHLLVEVCMHFVGWDFQEGLAAAGK